MSNVLFTNALGIDLGEKKVGIARINSIARIPEPLAVVAPEALLNTLRGYVAEYGVDLLVFGLPRNMSGEETVQSTVIRNQASEIAKSLGIKHVVQDETLSSVRAQDYIRRAHNGLEDAIAACIILEDFSAENSDT